MKFLATLLQFAFGVSLIGSFSGIDPVFVGIGAFALVALQMISPAGANGITQADTINIGEMADELKKLFKTQPGLPAKWYFSDQVLIRQFTKRIAKIKGQYHIPMWLLSSVVQGFKDEWTPFGSLHIKAKTLKDYHLKINLPIKPTEILGSYLGDTLYSENQALKDRPISRYIADMLNETVPDDMNILSIDGEYDTNLMHTEFGYSMKGLVRVLREQVAATIAQTTEHPMFIIPAEDALDKADPSTYPNIVTEIRNFERSLPSKFRNKVDTIFLERFWFDEYEDQYKIAHGGNTLLKKDDYYMTPGGRKLQPIDSEKMDTLIFATVKNNIIDMIDTNDLPRVHDIQTQDYTVKLFGEGRGGFDFAINQATFVRSEETSSLGLLNATQNQLLFKMQDVSAGSGSGS